MDYPPLERTLIVEAPLDRAATASARRGTLTVLTGNGMGVVRVLSGARSVLGRGEDAALVLDDPGVSRAHACIHEHEGSYELEDLGSSNGTFLDRGRIAGRVALHDGDRIWLANTLLRFTLQDEVEQAASQRMYDLSVRDGLTGLFNRRYLDERVAATRIMSKERMRVASRLWWPSRMVVSVTRSRVSASIQSATAFGPCASSSCRVPAGAGSGATRGGFGACASAGGFARPAVSGWPFTVMSAT
jgi:pSer/pThr/pTyr-binding forkhead associated (FHA) protein